LNLKENKMKLYTEEQVRKLLKKAFWQDFYEGDTEESLISELTPIELPTDEEIEETLGAAAGGLFCKGAKWMRDKLQGGNK